MTLLKHHTRLPIVFTVRTVSQGGYFPDKEQGLLFELLELGIRLGAEYIDVEITSPHPSINRLATNKGSSLILASYHDWSGNLSWSGQEVKGHYDTAANLGDVVKIVGKANSLEDNWHLRRFVEKIEKLPDAKPFIAIKSWCRGSAVKDIELHLEPGDTSTTSCCSCSWSALLCTDSGRASPIRPTSSPVVLPNRYTHLAIPFPSPS